ncbi:MAG: xylulokinase [Candidatus Jordarchaeum sp.]|uniref:xylulokinase n=1 Tax=Candidatus Jordarchaeum sp. TaxID=2823881 RepID=UPI00404AAEAC
MQVLAAIDAGTIGCRTIIFSENGREIARDYEEYPSTYPRPAWVEQNASDWWRAVCNTSKRAIEKAGINPGDIASISVTNQRETTVPVDEDGNPLRNAIVWQDRRTVKQCDEIRQKVGADQIYQIAGLTIDPYFSAPKILWIKENEPKIFDSTYKFMLVHDFIEMKLSNEFITDWSNASRTLLFDVEKFNWSEKICNALEIPPEKLVKTHASGKKIGEVTARAARETGFAEGTPVIAGGGDQQCGALGVGVIKPGRIKATMGTGTFLLAYTDKPKRDPRKRVLFSCHADPGKWVVEASMFTTGSVYRWFRDQLGHPEKSVAEILGKDPYEILCDVAEQAPPGSGGVLLLPHFVGAGAPYWDPDARGVIVGLALGHTRAHLVRAIMEGACFEVRKNIEVMKELGLEFQEVRITGGATRSPLWNQIQADIYNIPVSRGEVEEATSLGAAILAGVGVGVYKSVSDAAETMVQIGERREPDENNREVYDKLYKVHNDVYMALKDKDVYAKLSEFSV